jgi:hypothetical protein
MQVTTKLRIAPIIIFSCSLAACSNHEADLQGEWVHPGDRVESWAFLSDGVWLEEGLSDAGGTFVERGTWEIIGSDRLILGFEMYDEVRYVDTQYEIRDDRLILLQPDGRTTILTRR